MDDTRAAASETFRDLLRPLLALADEHPDASEVFVDGEEIRLSFGDRRMRYGFADFAGLRPRHVEAAGQAAAVFAGLEFGPIPRPCPCSRSRSRPTCASPTPARRPPSAGTSPSASCAPAGSRSTTTSTRAS